VSRRTEIQVGLLVLFAIVTLLLGVTWLKEFTVQRHVTVWHVRFPQTGGLGASDEVQVNGIRKGAVSKIALQGDRVVVDLALASEVRLTTDCNVAIRNVGLMGEKVIAVDLHTSGNPFGARDTIEGTYELGMSEVMARLGGSMEPLEHLASELDHVATNLHESGDLRGSLKSMRSAADELSAMVAENRKLLHETLENAAAVTRSARAVTSQREEQYARLMDSAERAAHNIEVLSARMDTLRATAQRIGDKVDHGQGTLARLVNDPVLHDDLRGTLKAMRDLLEDLKKNPKKYVNVHVF
jgi:phospholipid/cholesterol/gamma-HCH transport system substrate-binding protein